MEGELLSEAGCGLALSEWGQPRARVVASTENAARASYCDGSGVLTPVDGRKWA